MPKETTPPESVQKTPEKETKELNTWGQDQETHQYYYDDAHGYEKYDPQADDEECEHGR